MHPMGIVLRIELPDDPTTPLRVRVQREGGGIDYGWVRLDELPHLIAAMAARDGDGTDGPGR